jgi:hypothetical protein
MVRVVNNPKRHSDDVSRETHVLEQPTSTDSFSSVDSRRAIYDQTIQVYCLWVVVSLIDQEPTPFEIL